MSFRVLEQERILWASEWNHGWLNPVAFAVTLTNARLMMRSTATFGMGGLGESRRYVPLEMIDAVGVERSRPPFPLVFFLIGCLVFVVPGLIVLSLWLLSRRHVTAFGSSDESHIRLYGLGADADELIDAVETARRALPSQEPASSETLETPETPETALPSPPHVTLNA